MCLGSSCEESSWNRTEPPPQISDPTLTLSIYIGERCIGSAGIYLCMLQLLFKRVARREIVVERRKLERILHSSVLGVRVHEFIWQALGIDAGTSRWTLNRFVVKKRKKAVRKETSTMVSLTSREALKDDVAENKAGRGRKSAEEEREGELEVEAEGEGVKREGESKRNSQRTGAPALDKTGQGGKWEPWPGKWKRWAVLQG